MKYLLFAVFDILSNIIHFQPLENDFKAHGTLIVAAKCKDGIVMGADSRMTISANDFNNKKFDILSLDNCQKIMNCGPYLIGTTGMAYDGNFSFEKIIDSFLVLNPKWKAPSNFIKEFKPFVLKNFRIDSTSTIVCCGYYNSNSEIAYTWLGKNSEVKIAKCLFMSDNSADTRFCDSTLDWASQSKNVKKLIESYPKNSYTEKIIGGAVSLARVSRNSNPVWITNPRKFIYWYYYIDFIRELFDPNTFINLKVYEPDLIRELLQMYEDDLKKGTIRRISH